MPSLLAKASPDVIPLDLWHLALAGLLVLACGAASVALRLNLGRQILVASLRTVLQLALVGYVLKWVFAIDSPLVLLPVLGVMLAVAAHAGVGRSARKYRGIGLHAFAALTVSGLATMFFVTEAVIAVDPWYRPQYLIPLLGMILGNGLTGVSLCLDSLLEALHDRRAEVEMELALGATRREAALRPVRQAVRRGMVPILNSMAVVGLVSLPGMMTGQILSGIDPLTAVRYQIVVMFMILAGTTAACVGITLLACLRLFTPDHRLRWQDIAEAKG